MQIESPHSRQEFLEILTVYIRENNFLEIATTQDKFGDYLIEYLGEFNEATEYYYLAFNQYRRIGELEKSLLVYWKTARLHTKCGQFEKAIGIYNKILDITNSMNLIKYQSFMMADMGDIYRIMGSMTQAKEKILGSIERLDNQNILLGEASSIFIVYIRYLLANNLLEEAATQIKKIENQIGTNFYQGLLIKARYYILCEKFSLAEEILNQVIELPEQWNNLEVIGLAFLNFSLLRLRENDYVRALSMISSSYSNLAKIKSWRSNEAFHLASRSYLGLGKTQDAQEAAQKAMQGYLDLSLFERINHVEQTIHSLDTSIVDEFGDDELIYEFSNLGI